MDRLRVLSAIALCLLFCQPAASYADAGCCAPSSRWTSRAAIAWTFAVKDRRCSSTSRCTPHVQVRRTP